MSKLVKITAPSSNRQRSGTASGLLTLALLLSFGSLPVMAGDLDAKPASYSGETLFRGLFFGEGEVATMFPEIWYGRQLEAIEVSERGALVDHMRHADPSFFPRFSQAMVSGNHLLIKEDLDRASQLLSEAQAAARKQDAKELPADSYQGDDQMVLRVVQYVTDTSTARNIWAQFFWPHGAHRNSSQLHREFYVGLIVQRLS